LESIANQTHATYKVYLIGDRYENDAEFQSLGQNFLSNKKIVRTNLTVAKERDTYLGVNNKALWMYGGVNATNHGIDLALRNGHRYVCMIDHDDWLEPNHLANFNQLINQTAAKFMCSLSTHANGKILPHLKTADKKAKFIPARRLCIKSSCCVDVMSITCRFRDLYALTQKCDMPADADYWQQLSNVIEKHKFPSYAVNVLTCHHDEEGYSKTIK
jgi:glycosyltransferase involved in cell wall biosynthesis